MATKAEILKAHKDFDKKLSEGSYHEVGRFKNKHGEEFVMYHMNGVINLFVTGDELDWEIGWVYEQYSHELTLNFSLTSDEQDELESLYRSWTRPKREGKS